MEKEFILEQIRNLANEIGRTPGRRAFEAATGIREHAWVGVHWTSWSHAVEEAGLPVNSWIAAHDDDHLLRSLGLLARKLGHFPTYAEAKMERRSDPKFPSPTTFERLGDKAERIAKVAEFCALHPEFSDVESMCRELMPEATSTNEEAHKPPNVVGYVYLMKSGKNYKIGHSAAPGRRIYEIERHRPEGVTEVHKIPTDDPEGIEAYWHRRFASKRHGTTEWFSLTSDDVAVFKLRRRFM